MYALCIRYLLDSDRIDVSRTYVEDELPVTERVSGAIVGYCSPTDFAGTTNIGYGLIAFDTLSEYGRYRQALADDPTHQRNAAAFTESGAVLNMERSFIRRHGSTRRGEPR
jgi:hypothetical protein